LVHTHVEIEYDLQKLLTTVTTWFSPPVTYLLYEERNQGMSQSTDELPENLTL